MRCLVVLIPHKTKKTPFGVKIGAGGIRTPGGVAPAQTFQVCTLNHSDTAPLCLLSFLFFRYSLFYLLHAFIARVIYYLL